MKQPDLYKLLQSHLSEPLTAEEKRLIFAWEDRNEHKLKNLSSQSESELNEVAAQMLSAIHSRINKPVKSKRFISLHFYRIAAAVLIVSVFSYLFFPAKATNDFITIKAPKGSRKYVLLPDSTKVWLNAGSVMEYAANFKSKREIHLLEGEAYFDVKHLEKSSFMVLHDRFYAKVLGTAFNVKVYGKKDVRVTVTRGKVEVGRENKSYTVLTRDKEIILSRKAAQNTVAVRDINAQKVADWMSNKIHLYDVSFEDIILSIEDNYNVQVSYPIELMRNSISTLHYSSDKSLLEVLEVIKMIHKLDYKIEGKEVYLIKK